jgi:hypothetical protein
MGGRLDGAQAKGMHSSFVVLGVLPGCGHSLQKRLQIMDRHNRETDISMDNRKKRKGCAMLSHLPQSHQ